MADEQFPPYVETEDERVRFRLCVGIARELMDELDGPTVWQLTRSLYANPDLPS